MNEGTGIPMAKRSRKKRSAWGALTQVDAQTWRLRYWSAGPDGYRRRSKTVRGTRLDAERVRAERELLDAYRASDDRGRGNIADTAAREKSASERDVVRVDAGVGIKDNIS